MSHTLERISDNKVKITVTIPAFEVEDACKEAAAHLSKEVDIPGFRPGNAPYEVVKQRLGEMAILEHAAEDLVRATFVEAMLDEDLETVGQPFFSMDKLAPGNDFCTQQKLRSCPPSPSLPDYTKLEVKRGDVGQRTNLLTKLHKTYSVCAWWKCVQKPAAHSSKATKLL